MKRFFVLALLFTVALSAGAMNRKSVGSFHATDGYHYVDMTIVIWTDTAGNILFNAPAPYVLTQGDRDVLIPLLKKAIHYMQIAKDNSTTVDYKKDVGSVLTESGTYIVVKFITGGWENSLAEVWLYNSGRNAILSMSADQVNEMANALSAAVDTSADLQRQVDLFK